LEDGHSHPVAASFLLYGAGQCLSGGSGYDGVPLTANCNTLLIDGHGQEHDGSGHNCFYQIPYDRLNKIRIVDVKPDANGLTITADATAAYDPSLGLKSFVRTVRIERQKLTIDDSIEAADPHIFTVLIHFDGAAPPQALRYEVTEPKDATLRLEPNDVTAAGLPGSTDKGRIERRGSRLAISNANREATAKFEVILQW
jgi:hypothetical protein